MFAVIVSETKTALTTNFLAQLVHRHCKRKNVCRKAISFGARDLWGLIEGCPFARHRRINSRDPRDAIVGDFGDLTLGPDEDVSRLDVTVDNADCVEIDQARGALLRQ